MNSVQDHGYSHKEYPFVPLLDSFPTPELDDNLSDQFAGLSRANFPIAVISSTAFPVPKYTNKDLQRIVKTVLETQALIISKKS